MSEKKKKSKDELEEKNPEPEQEEKEEIVESVVEDSTESTDNGSSKVSPSIFYCLNKFIGVVARRRGFLQEQQVRVAAGQPVLREQTSP